MSQPELLKSVVEVLDRETIDYMITGSLASSVQGEPRASHDIDLVVVLSETSAHRLTNAFAPPDFYVSCQAALDAVHRSSMFNLLWITTGDKVDFWILSREGFDQSRFSRRRRETVLDGSFWVSSPEDTILAKLRWCKKSGGSEKQFTDALRVYEVQHGMLDEEYIQRWAVELQVTILWDQIRSSASFP